MQDLARQHHRGADILVVSSGAIALGRTVLKLPKGALKLEDSQASAAVGQIALARVWAEALGGHDIITGQVLVTLATPRSAAATSMLAPPSASLLELRAVPVINENDTVATSEIRYGDNDRLAARVASMMGADLLILLSDIDGLYTAPPHLDPNAVFIPVIPRITAEIESMAGGAASELSRGGMRTKIEAAKMATTGRLRHGDCRWPHRKPARSYCQRRPLLLVFDTLQPGHGPQEMDCRVAGAARRGAL